MIYRVEKLLNWMTSERVSFYSRDSTPYGKTYGSWTVDWWSWFFSIPKSQNPVLDDTGEYSSVNQPSHHVWFLAGKYADEDKRRFPTRSCTIPSNRSILFPVINCEANPLEYSELRSDEDIITRVKRDEDSIVKMECLVDGENIPAQRVKSDPLIFEIKVVPDNCVNIQGGGVTSASADGYWVFLKPLPVGEHNISFRGACEYGKLNSGADYRLLVTEDSFNQ